MFKTKWHSRALGAGLAGALAIAGTSAAAAQEITLRVADHYPPDSSSAKITIRYFMEEMEKATDGKVKFEYFPAEQLGKATDMLTLTVDGVTDIGLIAPPYISEKMPLSGVVELPGTFSTSCEGAEAFWKLATSGPVAEHDFAGNGIRPLFVYILPPYQILTRPKLTGLESLQGLKLRTGGGVQDLSIRAIGAVPVRIPGPDIYESLARGTLDGLVFPLPSIFQYHLEEHVKYSTRGQNFGSFSVTYSISEDKWNSLPEDVRKAMREVGRKTTRHACEAVQADIGPAIEKLEAAGVTMVDLPSEDVEAIKKKLAPVAEEWAKQLDERGLPGTSTLQAFRQALAH